MQGRIGTGRLLEFVNRGPINSLGRDATTTADIVAGGVQITNKEERLAPGGAKGIGLESQFPGFVVLLVLAKQSSVIHGVLRFDGIIRDQFEGFLVV